jgi:hypothetical protein
VLSYTIDAEGRIVAIDGLWDEFAAANGAPRLTRANVIGTLLLDHVVGLEPREIASLLLWRARSGHAVSADFRCDAPSLRRFLRMEIVPLPGERVRCSSILVREEERPAQALLDPRVPRSDDMLPICSWCRQARAGEGWLEIEEAVEVLGLLNQDRLPAITHTICSRCTKHLRRP